MKTPGTISTWRRKWLPRLAVLSSLLALLLIIQDATGIFWYRTVQLKTASFREKDGNIYRYTLERREAWIPTRFESVSKVFENGKPLVSARSKSELLVTPPGRFAWTGKNLWIHPREAGDPRVSAERFQVRAPRLVPLPLLLGVCSVAALLLMAALSLREVRQRWKNRWDFSVEYASRLLGLRTQEALGTQRWQSARSQGVAGLIAIVTVFFLCDAGRPIWIDEFLHFALAGYNSTSEALHAVQETTVNVNHGQTGVYMMLDYWLLKAFGANAVAMRLPSLFSMVFVMYCAAAIIRQQGLGIFWQILVLVALLGQQSCVVHYAAEARPYLPLAAACVGVLAYYMAPMHQRNSWEMRLVGWVSIPWGTLMHPYFAVYWLILFVFAHMVKLADGSLKPGIRSLVSHVNLPLSLVGGLVFLIVGKCTWMRGGPHFTFDPFEWIKREDLLNSAVESHLEFLGFPWLRSIMIIASVLALPALLFLRRRIDPGWQRLMAPALLLCATLAISAFLGWLSYKRDYWILARQWVASVALVPIAVVWLLGLMTRMLAKQHPSIAVVGAVALSWFIVSHSVSGIVTRFEQASSRGVSPSPSPVLSQERAPTPDEYVALANQNVAQGGDVWPTFARYYDAMMKTSKIGAQHEALEHQAEK